MTDKLPPHLLHLFMPRPPLRYLPPSDHAPEKRQSSKISGIAQFLEQKEDYDQIPFKPTLSWFEKKILDKAQRREREAEIEEDPHKEWKPDQDPNIRGDAFKTCFVSRLSYDVKTEDLEREFGRFGPIERIRLIKNENKKENGEDEKPLKGKQKRKMNRPHKGYAFIVFEREKDMKAAIRDLDGQRIKDRKIVVDVERGRTVNGWKPMRLGGGLGGRDYTKTAPAKPFGFGGPPSGPGGFRAGGGGGGGGGGFRGGFDRGFGRGGGGGGGFRDRGPGGYGGGGGPRGAGLGYGGGGGYGGRPPPNAPAGPGGGGRSGGGGGYGGGANGDDRGYRGGGGGRHGDRGVTGSNREPVRPRDGGNYQDRDRPREDRDRGQGGSGGSGGGASAGDSYNRKRYGESDHYEDPRQRRRY